MESKSYHWDSIFSQTADSKLGWFEKDAGKTFELLNQIPNWQNSTIFLPGAGTSVLIEALLFKGANLILNDISNEAINLVKTKLGKKSDEIIWLCQDVVKSFPSTIPKVDIWIDRAVLHFLTDEKDILGYFANLKSLVKDGGYLIFAEFSKLGAPKCAGLTLHRYSVDEISERLGNSFSCLSHFDYTFINPNGDPRPYVYALYKKERD